LKQVFQSEFGLGRTENDQFFNVGIQVFENIIKKMLFFLVLPFLYCFLVIATMLCT